MKRFIFIFLLLSLVELGVYFSPIRIQGTHNRDAKLTLTTAIDTLEMDYDGHILIKVRFKEDTVGYWFLWDTGAQASFIDEELIRKYNLQEVGLGRSVDSNLRARQTIRYKVDSLHINNALFENFIFSGLEIEKPKCGEKKYRGIIGGNIISTANWMIDYEKKKLLLVHQDSAAQKTLAPPGPFEVYTIPFSAGSNKGVPKIDMGIKGETLDDVIFDTGYSGSIVLPIKLYENNDLIFRDSSVVKSYGEVSKGLFGTAAGKMLQLTVDSLSMSDLLLRNQAVNFQSKTVKLLGNKILKNYFVYLKYDAHEVQLAPLPEADLNYTLKRKGFGFRFKYEDGRLTVATVHENSPAYVAGLEYKDEILCINEARFQGDECEVGEWYSNFLCETILLEVDGKGTLELDMSDKKEDSSSETAGSTENESFVAKTKITNEEEH